MSGQIKEIGTPDELYKMGEEAAEIIFEGFKVRRCDGCKHFGKLKGVDGVFIDSLCLAPADEGERFVYRTRPDGECELWEEIETS